MRYIALFLDRILQAIEFLLIVRIIISWIIPRNNFYRRQKNIFDELINVLYQITDPILNPFKILLPLGGLTLDIGPIVVFIIIRVLRGLLIYFF